MRIRWQSALRASVLALLPFAIGPGCYRAEIDLGLLAAPSPNSGGEPGSAGASGAPGLDCDMAPLDADQEVCRIHEPSREECTEQDREGWAGCYDGGCAVCTKSVRDYPYYFEWNRCCRPNTTCNSNEPVYCNARCKPPSERDKRRPCWLEEVTP